MKRNQNKSHLWEKNIKILTIIGLYSKNPKNRLTFLLVLFFSIIFIWNFIICSICLVNSTENIFDFAFNCEAFGAYAQTFVKMIVIVYNRPKLDKILEYTNHFWSITSTSQTKQEHLKKIKNNSQSLQYFYMFFAGCAATVLIGGAIWEWKLSIGVWTLSKKNGLFNSFLVQQAIFLPFMVLIAVCLDTLFVALSAEIIIQFKILCYWLEQLSVSKVEDGKQEDFLQNLAFYVKYHNYLLRFVTLLQEYFSPILLTEYLTITPTICAEMYGSFEMDNLGDTIRLILKFIVILSQLAFYCFTAHFVSNEALAVADAMYNSDWYSKPSPSITIPISLVIQRSQQQLSFRVGGLVETNIRTLLIILRTAWSACAVMRAIKNH